MHELAIARHLVRLVEEQARAAGAERVLAVDLALGRHSHVAARSLQLYYDLLTESGSSPARGALLRVRRSPMRFGCPACGAVFAARDASVAARDVGVAAREGGCRCPVCRAPADLVDAGDELLVESIEVIP